MSLTVAATSVTAGCAAVGLFAALCISLQSDQVNQAAKYTQDDMIQNVILPAYDFIVVGAGSAGSVVASRLSEHRKWTVLLLEAGGPETHLMDIPGLYTLFPSEVTYNLYTTPQKRICNTSQCYVPRGKVMGGCSTINGLMYVRGSPKNYDEWEAMGNDGWSYKDVLPYFTKSEDAHIKGPLSESYHGTGGLLTVSTTTFEPPWVSPLKRGFAELGLQDIDLNGPVQQGCGSTQFNIKDGVRVSTNRAFIDPVRGRRNLHVRTYTKVLKVLLDFTNRAVGVEIMDRTGETRSVAATKEIILSAGVYHSPQILMLSGIGPKDHLKSLNIPVAKDLPVGDNLHEQTALYSGVTMSVPKQDPAPPLASLMGNLTSFSDYSFRSGPMTTMPGQVLAFESYSGDPEISDILYCLGSYTDGDGCIPGGYLQTTVYNQINAIVGLVQPKSRGTLRLKDVSPFSDPIIDPNYLSQEEDISALIYGLNRAVNLTRTKSAVNNNYKLIQKPVPGCESETFGTDEYWKCAIRIYGVAFWHAVGTCHMAPFEKGGVVDSRLRVYGVRRLRVIDASIMPKTVSGNTNAAVMMIGEKGADMIAKDWILL